MGKSFSRSFAPASVANAAVGFDSLGFAVPILGDIVTATISDSGVSINSITGVVTNLPTNPYDNTASRGVLAMLDDENIDFGVELDIHKGIPLGSGLGGSATSAVAAVHAVNNLLDEPLSITKLLKYAIVGETASASDIHGDNVAPSLYGGLTIYAQADGKYDEVVNQLPIPSIYNVIIHPKMTINTRDARQILPVDINFQLSIKQGINFANFVHYLHMGNKEALRSVMKDLIVEKYRSKQIPDFELLKEIANQNNAIGFSISGSGPTVFAWMDSQQEASQLQKTIQDMSGDFEVEMETWICPISKEGAVSVEVR